MSKLGLVSGENVADLDGALWGGILESTKGDRMTEEVAHRLSIYLTKEEFSQLLDLVALLRSRDSRGVVSKSYVVAVAIRRMHEEMLGGKEEGSG